MVLKVHKTEVENSYNVLEQIYVAKFGRCQSGLLSWSAGYALSVLWKPEEGPLTITSWATFFKI
jgi:hypothetical protein